MSQSYPPKRDWHATIATWIVVLTTWGGMVTSWTTLSERTETLRTQHLEQDKAIRQCDERTRALENDRAIEKQLAEITNRLVAIEVKLQSINAQQGRRR